MDLYYNDNTTIKNGNLYREKDNIYIVSEFGQIVPQF